MNAILLFSIILNLKYVYEETYHMHTALDGRGTRINNRRLLIDDAILNHGLLLLLLRFRTTLSFIFGIKESLF